MVKQRRMITKALRILLKPGQYKKLKREANFIDINPHGALPDNEMTLYSKQNESFEKMDRDEESSASAHHNCDNPFPSQTSPDPTSNNLLFLSRLAPLAMEFNNETPDISSDIISEQKTKRAQEMPLERIRESESEEEMPAREQKVQIN